MKQFVVEDRPYIFLDYFNLNHDIEDILSYFGYTFQIQALELPMREIDSANVERLRQRMEKGLPQVSMTSEVARREFLIAPVLWELIQITDAKLKVEYPLQIDDKLKGTLDYLLQTDSKLLVVEAKNADPQRGFTQLAVELIALDKWVEDDTDTLYGAISLGETWRFGRLDRNKKILYQDIDLYTVPTNLEQLIAVLAGILWNKD